jgi:hypothetical protein
MVEKNAPRSRSVHDRRFIGRSPEQLTVLAISPTPMPLAVSPPPLGA